MKKRLMSLMLLLCMAFLLLPTGVMADDNLCEDYYRAYDYTGEMSDKNTEELDALYLEFAEEYKVDLVSISIDLTSRLQTAEEVAKEFFDDCKFGYGTEKSGAMLVYDAPNNSCHVEFFGGAEKAFSDRFAAEAEYVCPTMYENYGVYGVLYAFHKIANDDLSAADEQDKTISEAEPGTTFVISGTDGSTAVSVGENNGRGLPAWYPEDVNAFQAYHTSSTTRVVDEANLFSENDIERMEKRISAISAACGKDIAIYTAVSDYGFEHKILAADFYDFNGYGIGDEYEGLGLLICMDPDNRGFYTTATGPETRLLFSYDNSELLDDMLYGYMRSGAYAEGVLNWIDNVETLYIKGIPFAPEWYPDYNEPVNQYHADKAEYVFDESGVLTGDEKAKLTEQAAAISEKYGVDVVLHFAPWEYEMGMKTYSDMFYRCNGIGQGDSFRALVLTGYTGTDDYDAGHWNDGEVALTYHGEVVKHVNDTCLERISARAKSAMSSGKYYSVGQQYLKDAESMLKKGRVSRTAGAWIGSLVSSAVVGSVVGFVLLMVAKAKMKTISSADNADRYLDSAQILRSNDVYVYTTQRRTYNPPKSSGSGGSGGSSHHSSSYHSSYSGSSGHSHSGSGRSF